MTRIKSWLCVSLTFLSCSLFALQAEATHFRYGTLTWKARPDISSTTVEFSLVNAFRRCGYTGSGSDGCPITGDIITETIGVTALYFGDGTSIGNPALGQFLQYRVTAYDPSTDSLIATALDPNTGLDNIIHNFFSPNNAGSPWVAAIDSCCRLSTLSNSPNGSYRVETYIDLNTASSSPVSNLPPVISCPVGMLCQ